MSAELLRRAASILRERADDAILATGDKPWAFTGIGWTDPHGTTFTVNTNECHVAEASTEEQAIYIATMHPGVGLALADLLDMLAGDHEAADVDGSTWDHGVMPLARLIVGGAE